MLTLASDGSGTSVDQIHGVNGGGAAGWARMEEDGAPLFFQVSEPHQDEELKHGHHDAPPQQQDLRWRRYTPATGLRPPGGRLRRREPRRSSSASVR